jgi:hypothetical protein
VEPGETFDDVPVRSPMPPLFRSNMPPEGKAETTERMMPQIGMVVELVEMGSVAPRRGGFS